MTAHECIWYEHQGGLYWRCRDCGQWAKDVGIGLAKCAAPSRAPNDETQP